MSFASDNLERLYQLNGKVIESAAIVEMAMIESGPNNQPVFRLPDLPFIQAHLIELSLSKGELVSFLTHQNDDTWGIALEYIEKSFAEEVVRRLHTKEEASIFKIADDIEFPTGAIQNTEVKNDKKGDVTEIELTIGNHKILMKAGEVHETGGNNYRVTNSDESILLFLDSDDAKKVVFDS